MGEGGREDAGRVSETTLWPIQEPGSRLLEASAHEVRDSALTRHALFRPRDRILTLLSTPLEKKWGGRETKKNPPARSTETAIAVAGLCRHSSQSAEQPESQRLPFRLLGPPGLPGVAWAVCGAAAAATLCTLSAGFLLCRAGRCVQPKLAAPPVRRLPGAGAAPALFNGEGEGLDRGGEGGRKGGERVEGGRGQRSEPVPWPPAGRGWRSTNCWVPPSGSHSLHPTSPRFGGGPSQLTGNLERRAGARWR